MTQGYRILIVEDDYLQSYSLKLLLENLNYNVVGIAESGVKAINMAEKLKPDLVLMDITLSGDLDGIDTAKIIHKSSVIPIIYITGYTSKFFRKKAKSTPHLDYLIKPVTKKLLTDALTKCPV